MGQQIFAQINLLAELQAMQAAGSQEFEQLVAKAAQSTEEHLQEAKQIMQSLESGGEERLSRRPEQQPQQRQP